MPSPSHSARFPKTRSANESIQCKFSTSAQVVYLIDIGQFCSPCLVKVSRGLRVTVCLPLKNPESFSHIFVHTLTRSFLPAKSVPHQKCSWQGRVAFTPAACVTNKQLTQAVNMFYISQTCAKTLPSNTV